MPKRRKKPVRKKMQTQDTTTNGFPYPRVRIHWKDILGDSGWADEEDFKKMKPTEPISDGYLFHKDKDMVLTFGSYDVDTDGKITFGDRNVYPTGCIRRIEKLN